MRCDEHLDRGNGGQPGEAYFDDRLAGSVRGSEVIFGPISIAVSHQHDSLQIENCGRTLLVIAVGSKRKQ